MSYPSQTKDLVALTSYPSQGKRLKRLNNSQMWVFLKILTYAIVLPFCVIDHFNSPISKTIKLYSIPHNLPVVLAETGASYTKSLQTGKPASGEATEHDIKCKWIQQILAPKNRRVAPHFKAITWVRNLPHSPCWHLLFNSLRSSRWMCDTKLMWSWSSLNSLRSRRTRTHREQL